MSDPTAPCCPFLVRTATDAAPSFPADGEPLDDRVWRQVRDGLDRERLLPADDKHRPGTLPSAWTSRPSAAHGPRTSPDSPTIGTGQGA